MKKRRSISKVKLFLLLVAGLFLVRYLFFRAPSESQMIAHLKEHKAEFENLRAMLQKDRQVETIGNDWVRGPNWSLVDRPEQAGITEKRLTQYREIMRKLGLQVIHRATGGKSYFQFDVFGGGFADTTWGIGYAWSSKALSPLVKSAYSQMPGRDRRHFSEVEGNWYIYHRR